MVLITTAIEFCPALHTEVSVFIMSEFLGASRGMQLERGEEGGGSGDRKDKEHELKYMYTACLCVHLCMLL